MARRPGDEESSEVLSEKEVEELRRNLSLLSASHALKFYQDSYRQAAPERRPCARVMQQLITAWKILRRWDWK